MPTVALIYCRVSSDRQATEGHGVNGQVRRCREYAVAHGFTVAAVFRDEGASGGTIDRPALRAMFDYMRRQDADMVLFEDVICDECNVLRQALVAFWAVVAGAHPEINFGDGDDSEMRDQCRAYIREWVSNNTPEEEPVEGQGEPG